MKIEKTVLINKRFVEQFKEQSEVAKENINNRINTYKDEDSLTLRFTIEDFNAVEAIASLCENETVEVDAVFEKNISNKGIYFILNLTIHQTEEDEPEFESIDSLINEITEIIRQESRIVLEIAKEKANQRVQNEIKFATYTNSDLFILIRRHFTLKPNSSNTAMFGTYNQNRNIKCVFINYQKIVDMYDTFDISVTYTKHFTTKGYEHRFKIVFMPDATNKDDFNFHIPTFLKKLVTENIIAEKVADKLTEVFF